MNSNKQTIACPLDCFDACEAVVIDEKIKGNASHPITKSKLCVNFAQLLKEDFLEKAYVNKKEVPLNNALEEVVNKLKNVNPENTLYYSGAGNLGVMQSCTKTFFDKFGSNLTKGSLCDGAGGLGLELGRGHSVNPPIEKLIASDVIIVWGRNFSITSPHMYNLVKDKTFITIDPTITPIAKKSELHLRVNPKTDYELALLLTRFAYMEDLEDEEFIENHGVGADWFFDLAKSRPLVSYEKTTGISLSDITKLFEIIKNKSVSIVLGLGVQKYYEGVNITRAIDSFAAYIGLHNKEKGGLWYLGDSSFSYEKQFPSKRTKKVSLPEVDFGKYELVVIQGANPMVSAPNTKKIKEGLANTFVIFFGTTFNDTCEYADIVIPSSNFKTKKDVRLSYGHQYKAVSNEVEEKNSNTISEYEFTKYLHDAFSFEGLKNENEAFEYYVNKKIEDNSFIEKFEFLEELEVENLYEVKKDDEFYFITAKNKNNLNSQFNVDNHLYMNSACGFEEGCEVKVRTSHGSEKFILKYNDDVRKDCVLCYSGNKKTNYLTPFACDEQAFSAIYQEVLVRVELP